MVNTMRRAFTLIELMVVVAMILIVAAIVIENVRGNKTVTDNGVITPEYKHQTGPANPLKPIRDSGKIER